MADAPKPGFLKSTFKWVGGGVLGLVTGTVALYASAIFDKVAKPSKPVSNFAVSAEGLTITCQNLATGETGWWDFGDGSPLEPFDPAAQAVPHTYSKPGGYSIKLIVRNFLNEENDRSVSVDLSAPPNTLPPSIVGLSVEPIGSRSVAPATFRVRGEVKNADKVILDLGEQVEVNADRGPFERFVVFEKPGQFPIQVIGHSGKTAVKQATTVTVAAPTTGSLSVVLRVTDTANKIVKQDFNETAVLPQPAKGSKVTERTISARPGFTITSAKPGKTAGIQNLKLEVSADKKSVKVSGEPSGAGDTIVPLVISAERSLPESYPPAMAAAPLQSNALTSVTSFGYFGETTLPLPPQPLNVSNLVRRITIELQETRADGSGSVLLATTETKLPWNGTLTRGSTRYPVKAEQVGETVKITVGSKP